MLGNKVIMCTGQLCVFLRFFVVVLGFSIIYMHLNSKVCMQFLKVQSSSRVYIHSYNIIDLYLERDWYTRSHTL